MTVNCFVIGPIGDRNAEIGSPSRSAYEKGIEVLEEIIVPACQALGIEALRADQISDAGEIPEQVFMHLRDDDIVIADLSGGNANVMYELGLRHTLSKLTIQLGEVGDLPFDVSAIRTIVFKRTAGGLIEARKRLTQTLAAGLEGRFGSSTATRVFAAAANLLAESGLVQEADSAEPGYLEKMASMEASITDLAPTINRFNELVTAAGACVGRRIAGISSDKTAGHRVRVANELAQDLVPIAEELEVVVERFRSLLERVDPGTRHLLRVYRSGEQVDDAGFVEAVETAARNVGQTSELAVGLADQLRQSGEATRSLRKVGGHMAKSLETYAELAQRVMQWSVHAHSN